MASCTARSDCPDEKYIVVTCRPLRASPLLISKAARESSGAPAQRPRHANSSPAAVRKLVPIPLGLGNTTQG